jgi:hypothetical protein
MAVCLIMAVEFPSGEFTGIPPEDRTPRYPPSETEVPEFPRLVWRYVEGGVRTGVFNKEFLGANPGYPGHNTGYKNSAEREIPAAGLVFRIYQRTGGLRGIMAAALPGYAVEALAYDSESKQFVWQKTSGYEDSVTINPYIGNWSVIPADVWSEHGQAVPASSGIVRITQDGGGTKYFALGAEFNGKPDHWWVDGMIAEVSVPDDMTDQSGSDQNMPMF